MPRRHEQDPLPAPPGLDGAGPRPARDPRPARAPARLLHPADHHRAAPGRGQDRAKARPAERTFATAKDPASNDISRGWCRLTGLTPIALWLACLLAVRNQRILTAYSARQADNARRAAAGLPPRTRWGRRRKTLAMLAAAPP